MQIYKLLSDNFNTESRIYHNRIRNSDLLLNHPYLSYVWLVITTHKMKDWGRCKHITNPDEEQVFRLVSFEAIPNLFNIDRRVLKKQLDELERMRLVVLIRNKHKSTTVIVNPYFCNCFTMSQKLTVLQHLNPEHYRNESSMTDKYG